ncbi:restriction endonuclease subunit S [Idiomarina loihiensis]|uniref:Restriction endonuclease S subunit n=1 Tax=Idiomarina loihiensis (strain ATCC BAA-735 / DSM 15497 / L2-TR) TaxID=283942 RepID=Q5QX28_IDILO|nr:restriction endonuclease subunit S [Idiomarina loihiensis]AAV81484.1 Restriction endonuclease S subunit [Idiomarina loihiensis L2TR]AGM35511.1 restriction endonuclease S subunit [Idiomarina loihiensis GSL 199]
MNKPIHESETRTVRDLKELLPERWKLIKLKLVCNIETGFAFPSEVFGETGTPVIRITDIKNREINLSEIKRVDDLLLKSKPKRPSVNKGDIIMAMTGATIGKVGYYNSDKPSYLNQRVCRFIPASIDRGYLWHTLNSEIYKKYIELEAFGGAQANISDSQLLNFPAPLPELEAEQQKIAQFLDYETAKIDALIDEQKRLIELLKEKRQAVISHAVTKGLNPDAPMKDSGIEWLGEVPEHWEIKKLKFCSRMLSDKGKDNTNAISLENIENGTGAFIKTESNFDQEGVLFEPLDILFGKLRPYLAKVYLAREHGSALGDILVFRANKDISPEFLFFRLISQEFIRQVDQSSYGSKMPRANPELIKSLQIAVPPIEEQVKVSDYLANLQFNKIMPSVINASSLVKLLEERRSALISAAVTGKIDVRDWQPPAGSDTVDSNASVQTERHYG